MVNQREIFPGHFIDYPVPLHYKRDHRHLFYDENFSFQIPSVKVYEIENVRFNSDTLIKGNEVLDHFLRHHSVNRFNQLKRAFRLLLQKVIKHEKAILGFQVWSNNYFHWITETVPSICALHKLDGSAVVILPESLLQFSFVRDVISLMSWDYQTFCDSESIRATSLLAIQPPHVGRFNHRFLQEAVCQMKFKTDLNQEIIPFRKVYISRVKARRRKISNECKLEEMLIQRGFEIHILEDYSLEKQITLFHEAELVLSNHGAGLSNIMFMNPRSTVIELKSENNDYWCFYSLANVFQLRYSYTLCKGSDKNHREADIEVNLDLLSDQLDQIFTSDQS